MCLKEKCHLGPVWSNNSVSFGGSKECRPWVQQGLVRNSVGCTALKEEQLIQMKMGDVLGLVYPNGS